MKKIIYLMLALFLLIEGYGEKLYGNYPDHGLVYSRVDTVLERPGIAVYPELLGKGFYSFNIDFPITANQRFSFGLTQLDYDIEDYENFQAGPGGSLTGGLMYYYLNGKGPSFFELGMGFSLYHRLGLDYHEDSPLSLHGVVGYRYQKKEGLLFRAGFTPFQRVKNWFLPLIGISLGYSW